MDTSSATALAFRDTTFHPIFCDNRTYLTSGEIARALGYERDTFVHRLFLRHSAEFTEQMTGVVKLTTPGGEQDVRIFSLRGAHLLGMFARTGLAAEFRRWVLDVLDRELAYAPSLGDRRWLIRFDHQGREVVEEIEQDAVVIKLDKLPEMLADPGFVMQPTLAIRMIRACSDVLARRY